MSLLQIMVAIALGWVVVHATLYSLTLTVSKAWHRAQLHVAVEAARKSLVANE